MCARNYVWNPATCGKHLASIIDDPVITCDEIIVTTRAVPLNGAKYLCIRFDKIEQDYISYKSKKNYYLCLFS